MTPLGLLAMAGAVIVLVVALAIWRATADDFVVLPDDDEEE